MKLTFIRRILGIRPYGVFYPPVMKGPPPNPQYVALLRKPGQYPKHELDERDIVRDPEADSRLFDLRRAHYAALYPDVNPNHNYGFRYQNARLLPEHLPEFAILKKKIDFSDRLIPSVSVGAGPALQDSFLLVRRNFKDAVQSLDLDLCQFFPFEFRLKSGQVIEQLFIMHFPVRPMAQIVMEKSGATRNYHEKGLATSLTETWSGPNEDIVRNGQLVLRLEAPEKPIHFCNRHWLILSLALADKLRPFLPAIEDFYPVHVEGES